MAASRDAQEVAALQDPGDPAVLELIARVATYLAAHLRAAVGGRDT